MAIKVNLDKNVAQIKPMHGSGGGPRQGGATLGFDSSLEFKEIGVPFARLHDIENPYGAGQYVNIHCIFPDFDADVDDEASYHFGPTDKFLNYIISVGTQVFFRLGESIEHFSKKLFIHPPKDSLKWARICEHIIRHYNEGWANGFEWNITYWEIWNEPDNFRMWTGDLEQFYDLFKTTAIHLKKCFPNLKIGGYSASGFYTETRENCGEWFRTLVPYTLKFFEKLSMEEQKVPMDFFSWHCYANRPEEIYLFAEFVQKLLKKYGYEGIESILTEYNTMESLKFPPSTLPHYAAELGAGLITAQNSPMDALIYYDMRIGAMNGIFTRNKYWKLERLHGFYALKFFGDLYRLKNQVEISGNCENLYVLAANDGEKFGIMLAVRDFSGEIEMEINGTNQSSVNITESSYEETPTKSEIDIRDGKIKFSVKKHSLYYIEG